MCDYYKKAFWLICLLTGFSIHLNAQSSSDFSVDADGWNISNLALGTTIAASYNSTGGNPGGNISYTINAPYNNVYFNAPSKFIGNISDTYNKTLTFDLFVSTAGTDNTYGDVIISGANNLQYQLPVKPAAGTWTSYTVPLNEASWHNACPSCPAPTQAQMKQTLGNVTSITIRLKYVTGNVTTALDNVVLSRQPVVTAPVITSIAPLKGLAGSSVTVTGTNFNTTATQTSVFFGTVEASIVSVTATQIVATVPAHAPFGSIFVQDNATGRLAASTQNFGPLFNNNNDAGGRIIPASMARGYYTLLPMNSTMSNGFGLVDKGDLDGDGWVDLVVTETQDAKIFVYRNNASGGSVSVSSFDSPITLPSLAAIPGGGPNLTQVLIADIDADGKLDVVASTAGNTSSEFAVYRNVSTAGNISFNSPLFFAYPYYNPLQMAAADLDGDGRLDLVGSSGTSPANVFITQNLSTPGNIDFAYGKVINAASTPGYSEVVIADLNGDGRPEVVCPGYNATDISIYQNVSTPGTITMSPLFTIPQQVSYTTQLVIADLDADNKPDLAWSTYGAQFIYLTKNLSTGGTLSAASFGTTIQIPNKLYNPNGIGVSDINSDGLPDIVLTGSSDAGIMQNVGQTGLLSASSFTSPVLLQGSPSAAPLYLAGPVMADLDGDNKPEVITVYTNSGVPGAEKGVYIYHNESFPAPLVTAVTPQSVNTGDAVNLTGTSLATGSTSPEVRLGKIISTVTSATNTVVGTSDPLSGLSGRFNITNHGLTGFSPYVQSVFPTTRIINATSFGPAVDFSIAANPRDALTIGDFDDDGKPDVALIENGFTGRVFQNTAASGSAIGTSSLNLLPATLSANYDLIAIDADGDGKTDIHAGSNLYQNTGSVGSITFGTAVTAYPSSYSAVAAADFNKDGKTDLTTMTGTAFVEINENLTTRGGFVSTGNFQSFNATSVMLPKNSGTGGIVAEDFDGDGFDDIAATNSTSGNFTVFLNLQLPTTISISSFSTGTTTGTGLQPYGLAAVDFDGDKKIDIAVVHNNQLYVSVYLNTSSVGNVSFAAPVNLPCLTKGYAIAAQDLDGDGFSEIVAIHQPNPGPGSYSVFKNNSTPGNLSFGAAVNTAITRDPQALAIADMNGDQKPDILIVGSGGSTAPATALSVFQNNLAVASITIVTQPNGSYTVCSGVIQAIATSATGAANIAYQWQILDPVAGTWSDLSNTGGYTTVSQASLTINTTGNFGAGSYRCKISGDAAATVYSNSAVLNVNALPSAPGAGSASICGPGSVVLHASGGDDGQYQWYAGTVPIADQNDGAYTTPTLTATTVYGVTLSNGSCESIQTTVSAIIKQVPPAPSSHDVIICTAGPAELSATGGSSGEYQWYTVSTGGTSDPLQNNGTFETPSVSATTAFYVSLLINSCEGPRTTVNVNFGGTACSSNLPPVISVPVETIVLGAIDTLYIRKYISDPNNNLDFSTLTIVVPPTSGASATIDPNHDIVIDYSNVTYTKTDELTIRVCDSLNSCTQQTLQVDILGSVVIYAGVSPNGDDRNEILEMEGIENFSQTQKNQVIIYNRWGDEVFKISDYNNTTHAFSGLSTSGAVLPDGIYFYKVSFSSGIKSLTGYLDLKR